MNISSKNARFIGLLLLSTLLSLILTFQTIPGFDARSEYFAAEFQKLVGIRVRFAAAIVLTVITGLFATATGILIKRVFQQDGITWSGGAPVFFLTSGFGFFLSAFFGIPVLLALNSAARSYQSDWADLAASASPWAGANQAFLVIFGLGGFALSLLMTALALIRSGGLPLRLAVIGIGIPFVPLVVFLLIPGPDPYFLLAFGLPALFWSVGLGAYITITGRLSRFPPSH